MAKKNCVECGVEFAAPPTGKVTCSARCASVVNSKRKTKHGCEPKRLYQIWLDMKNRVKARSRTAAKYYSHVLVSMEWWNDFTAFRDWALANGYAENLEIDRIDRDGHYEPSNCRWATRTEQMRNTRTRVQNNKTSAFRGVAKCTKSKVNPWRATGTINSKPFHLGVFKTEVEAARAYDAWARVAFGEFASLNFRDGESSKAG